MYSDSGPIVGQWWWDPGTQRLRIEPHANAALDYLGGTWSLSAFGVMLDGFSRSRLERTFAGSNGEGGDIRCAIGLSDGAALHLVGAFDARHAAAGELRRESSKSAAESGANGSALEAVFQPIVSLSTGQVAGFEALARWGGSAPAEHSENIGMRDDALAPSMLARAAEALASWQEAVPGCVLFVNVNVTGRDLALEGLPELVASLISRHGFAPGQLRIELTEQAALRDIEEALQVTSALKEAGAGLILDDFGTGHSSFSWLAALPADGLKIDPGLTRHLDSEKVRIVLETVTLLAARLNMPATAEGIESLDQIGLLRSLGFHYGQGFAFSHPMSASQAGKFLKQSR